MVFIILENEDEYTGKTEILQDEKCVVLRFVAVMIILKNSMKKCLNI